MLNQTHRVIIIGSGPAGHTAGIYAARANLKPIMFEGLSRGGVPGGQLMITNDVENYPGFSEKITGPELMARFREQSVKQGTEVHSVDVNRVDFRVRPFSLWVGDEDDEVKAHTVVIATGAQARWLGLPSEKALQGRGVSACAVCDGSFFRGQNVMVVGGGDTAMEEAMYLSALCHKVYLVHRRSEFRASKAMQDRVKANSKIEIIYDALVEKINDVEKGEVTSAVLKHVRTGVEMKVDIAGFFVAIGHTPNSELFRDFLDLHENGYIKTKPGTCQTSVEGIFAAGDVQDFVYRQAITAAGSGCMAALEAERYLTLHNLNRH